MSDYIKIDLNGLKNKFEHELSFFNDYLKFNNEKLSQRQDLLKSYFQQDIKENPDAPSLLKEIYYLDFNKIPSYFYHSSIVSLYSLLENNLTSICDKIQSDTDLVIGLSDLGGVNIIQKARKFLIKFAAIDFSVVDKEWLRITDYQKLRNLIVHSNSQLKSSDNNNGNDDFKIISKFKGIDIDNHNHIFYITNYKILIDFLKIIENFIQNIISQIEESSFRRFYFVSKDFLPF